MPGGPGMRLQAGARLGPYEILDVLGAGGMGEVYRARDPRIGRDVALKVLASAVATDPDRVRRFQQEARASGVLNHPNIVTVFDVGTSRRARSSCTSFSKGKASATGSAGAGCRSRRPFGAVCR